MRSHTVSSHVVSVLALSHPSLLVLHPSTACWSSGVHEPWAFPYINETAPTSSPSSDHLQAEKQSIKVHMQARSCRNTSSPPLAHSDTDPDGASIRFTTRCCAQCFTGLPHKLHSIQHQPWQLNQQHSTGSNKLFEQKKLLLVR